LKNKNGRAGEISACKVYTVRKKEKGCETKMVDPCVECPPTKSIPEIENIAKAMISISIMVSAMREAG
jgi:hypothetical protein